MWHHGKSSLVSRFFAILKISMDIDRTLVLLKVLNSLLAVVYFATSLILPKFLLQMLNEKNAMGFFCVLICTSIIELILSFLSAKMDPVISYKEEIFKASAMEIFLEKSCLLSIDYFDDATRYNKYTLVFERSCTIFQETIDAVSSLITMLMQLTIVIVVLSWMNPVAIIIMVGMALLQAIVSKKIRKYNYKFQANKAKHSKKLNYLYRLFWIPEYMVDIRLNNLCKFILGKKRQVAEGVAAETEQVKREVGTCNIFKSGISALETIAITSYLGYMVLTDIIWFDTFVVSQSSYVRLKGVISQFQALFSRVYENDFYIKDYLLLINSSSENNDLGLPLDSKSIETIEFDNVSFGYLNGKYLVLKNVNFKICRGEKVFIAGKNGAGKTTILKLLVRLYEPSSGRILINGRNIRDYRLKDLRNAISVLLQNYVLYAFSIRENLVYGDEKVEQELEDAVKCVGLRDRISSMRDGFQSSISNQLNENGIELSSGERQKLAISRILLKSNGVVLLDEPTCNMDPQSEKDVIDHMLSLEGVTVILVSHQHAFSKRCSKILKVENGTVLECESLFETDAKSAENK